MKILKITAIALLLSSCIMINENSFRGLPKKAMNYIKPFDTTLVSAKVNNHDKLYLYEINSDDIKVLAQKEKYLWVHLWRPFCGAEICQNVDYFNDLANKYQRKGLKLLFISETYDFNDIMKTMKHSWFDRPVFVLQDSYYGHKLRKNRIKLMESLNPELKGTTKIGLDDYFYKDNNLIYSGHIVDEKVLDSLMSI